MKSMKERKRCPKHPGIILETLYLKPLSLTISKFSKILGVSRNVISAIINGHRCVTPEIALRLSQAFPNTTPESWLNLQRNYDLWKIVHSSSDWKTVHAVEVNFNEKHKSAMAH